MSEKRGKNDNSAWLTQNQLAELIQSTAPGARKFFRLADVHPRDVRQGPPGAHGPAPREYRFRALIDGLLARNDPDARALKLEADRIKVDAARVDLKSRRLALAERRGELLPAEDLDALFDVLETLLGNAVERVWSVSPEAAQIIDGLAADVQARLKVRKEDAVSD